MIHPKSLIFVSHHSSHEALFSFYCLTFEHYRSKTRDKHFYSRQSIKSPHIFEMDFFGKDSVKTCLFKNNDCSGKIVSAHSIQNSFIIDALQEKGHVYRFFYKDSGCVFEKIGRNNASTFTGFCKKHDNEIFSPIDFSKQEKINKLTPEQIVLFHFRALAKEYCTKLNAIKKSQAYSNKKNLTKLKKIHPNKDVKKMPIDEFDKRLSLAKPNIETFITGSLLGLQDMERGYQSCKYIIENKKHYHHIKGYHIVFPKKNNFAVCSYTSPICDFEGNLIPHLLENPDKNYGIAINCFPDGDKSHFIITWHKRDDNILKPLSEQIDRISECRKSIEISKFLVCHCENMLFKISDVDSQSEKWKEKVLKTAHYTTTNHQFILSNVEDFDLF